ncbi:hypothetical protein GCM10017788_28000 [Amycolatopsis acidiphila]|nr:hypothetical protein GCM10017788_28000 [Amycolatopsis acidiphila]
MAAPPAAEAISTAEVARKHDSSAVNPATTKVSLLDNAALAARDHGRETPLGSRMTGNATPNVLFCGGFSPNRCPA